MKKLLTLITSAFSFGAVRGAYTGRRQVILVSEDRTAPVTMPTNMYYAIA